jgi:hypothetical protein
MLLTKSTFENTHNQEFTIQFDSQTSVVARLIEIKSINSHVLKTGQNEPFSLVLETPGDTVYEQNTYMMQNKELGELTLFLVPIGADKKGVRYEAIFT